MRLLVTGGRDFTDVEFIVTHLNRLHRVRGITHLIHGAARGVDTISAMWADEVGVTPVPFPVEDWYSDTGKIDKGAGHRRNQRMLDEGEPDALFAFPGGGGTADMVRRANRANVHEVWVSERNFFKKEDPASWFMSNFAEGFGFKDDDGIQWDTSEHYYQAMRSVIPEEQEYIRVADSPGIAKKRKLEITTTDDWDDRKIPVMQRAIDYKFSPESEAARLLLCTGIEYLIEWAPWGDDFWGVNKYGVGQNWLGRILMDRREKLKDGYT